MFLCGYFTAARAFLFLASSLIQVQCADILSITGNMVYGQPFRLVCATRTTNTTTFARFYRSTTGSSDVGLYVGEIVFRPYRADPCTGIIGSNTNYTYGCADDGSAIYLTVPADNLAEQGTHWGCSMLRRAGALNNNYVYVHITAVTDEDILSVRGDMVYGQSFQLVCATGVTNETTVGQFFRSTSAYRTGNFVGGALYQPTNADPCTDLPNSSANYTYGCADDGSEVYLTVPADNLVVHGTYWRCSNQHDTIAWFNNNRYINIITEKLYDSVNQYGSCGDADLIGVFSGYKCFQLNGPVTSVTLVAPVVEDGNVITLTRHETTSFHCRTSSGRPVATIRWFLDGVEMTGGTNIPLPGWTETVVTNGYLEYSADVVDHGKTLYCTASNYLNMTAVELSPRPTLNVLFPPDLELQIGSVGYSQYDFTEYQADLELACHVVAANPVPSTYRWIKDGETIPGQGGSTYSIDRVELSDDGSYTCTANNSVGMGTSSPLHINVRYLPVISQLVGDGTFDVNATVVLTCTVDGGPDTRISWFRQGTNQPIHSEILNKPGTSRLVLERIQCTQMSAYTCIAENSVGAKQKSVDVLVKCPPMEDRNSPTDHLVFAELGTSVFLEIHVISFRLPTFTWQQLDDGSLGPLDQSTTQMDGDRTSKLTITNLQGFGVYSLTVSNGVPPDAVFHFNISEKAEISLKESQCPTSISVAAAVGIGVSALVVGCVLTALVFRFHRSCRTLLCRDRLYSEAKPDTGEHQYAEVQPGASSTLALQERSPANVGVDYQQEAYENL